MPKAGVDGFEVLLFVLCTEQSLQVFSYKPGVPVTGQETHHVGLFTAVSSREDAL